MINTTSNNDLLQHVFEASAQGILMVKKDGSILNANSASERLFGYDYGTLSGKNIESLIPKKFNQLYKKYTRASTKNAKTKAMSNDVEVFGVKKDGSQFPLEISLSTYVIGKENITVAFLRDATKLKEGFLKIQKSKEEILKKHTRIIIEQTSKNKPLKSVSLKIIETIETHIKDCAASISVLNKELKTLHNLTAPNVPEAFSDFIEGITIGPKVGSCGTAAFLKNEVIVSNIQDSILWEGYKVIALKNGLQACWSFPILSSTKQVLGTLTIYSWQPRKPLPKEKEMIFDMVYLIGIAIEKHNNILTLQQYKKELENYTQILEDKVEARTQEVMATVQELVAINLNLGDQILIANQAQKNALASKKLTADIAQHFPKGFIIIVDSNYKIILAAGEALTQLGLRQVIFEGMLIDDIRVFSEERKIKIKEDITKTLSGQHLSFEINYKNRYFAVNTMPLLDEHNVIINALLVYNDISFQKEIELKTQGALKIERELNDLKSRFVSMASHEFRTPLSAILTSAILIGKQNEPGLELKREKYIVQIERNVKNLTIILNDFLSLSKVEEGKIVAKANTFNVIHFLKSIIQESKINLKKDQKVNFHNITETLIVYLDAKLLQHIITNLLSNASKYSAENSSIDFKIFQNKENVQIEVTDDGIGIPEEEQKNLFQRFYRAKNTNNIEGTGIGLNIAKHYTELMGGNITFKSKLNKGTTFLVEFPINGKA